MQLVTRSNYVVAIVKDEHRFVIIFDKTNKKHALRQVGRWAHSTELTFSWRDAAVMSQHIRKAQHE